MTDTTTQAPAAPAASTPAPAVPAAAAPTSPPATPPAASTPVPAPEPEPAAKAKKALPVKAKEGQEIWETVTDATVFLTTEDSRGRIKTKKYGGKKGSRIRISVEDREYVEENLRDFDRSPFRSGILKQVGGVAVIEDERNHLSDEEMVIAFKEKSGIVFERWISGLNEINLYRARDMLEAVDATRSQTAAIEAALAPLKKGHTVETWREMQANKDVAES
jgi:hypothetical protein